MKRPGAVDIWRVPGPLPEIEPISVPSAPGALLRSLGDPPMRDGAGAADVFIEVIERASAIAAALALSVGLLADQPDD
ncbi:MAG: hypothetical protein ACXVIQ_08415 [Ilumatobacteraceae bacterium]